MASFLHEYTYVLKNDKDYCRVTISSFCVCCRQKKAAVPLDETRWHCRFRNFKSM